MREVVVQHERLFIGSLQRVDELLVLGGAQCRDHQSLRLAAGEQRRAVGARQHADFRHDLPDGFHVAAVDTLPVSRMFQRTILASSSLNTPAIASLSCLGSKPSGKKCSITFFLTTATASWRSCLRTIE